MWYEGDSSHETNVESINQRHISPLFTYAHTPTPSHRHTTHTYTLVVVPSDWKGHSGEHEQVFVTGMSRLYDQPHTTLLYTLRKVTQY